MAFLSGHAAGTARGRERASRRGGQLFGGGSGSARIGDGELLEGAWPEVAHIMDIVALEQLCDAASLSYKIPDYLPLIRFLCSPAQLPPGAEMVPVSWKLNVP